jgi:hypothetical protein
MKTYFYEKPNGEIFACEAYEAADVHKKFKQVGVSDGVEYATTMKNYPERLRKLHARVYAGEEKDQVVIDEYEILKEARRKELLDAFAKELEKARGHFELPPDNSILSGSNIIGKSNLKL